MGGFGVNLVENGVMMEKESKGPEKDKEPTHVKARKSWSGQDYWVCPKCNIDNVAYMPTCHSCGELVIIDFE